MNIDELLEYLDIENGSEFIYFEDFANLVELEEDVDEDALYELFKEVDMKNFREICFNYFEDIMRNIPGDQIDLYNLLENIKRVLSGITIAVDNEEENALLKLVDEFNKFRKWYSVDKNVLCRELTGIEESPETVRDAIVNARLEKLEGPEFSYDFSKALEYELEEFMMTYADLITPEDLDDGMEEMREFDPADEYPEYDVDDDMDSYL